MNPKLVSSVLPTVELQDKAKPRSRAAYQAERRKHSIPLAFKDEAEKARFAQMAAQSGYVSFNAYLLQMLRNATSGAVYPPEYVEGLQKEVEKLRAWLDQAREEAAELRKDGKLLLAEKEALAYLLSQHPDGPAILATVERTHGQTRRGVL